MKELYRPFVQQKATLLDSGDDDYISDEYNALEIVSYKTIAFLVAWWLFF